MTEFVTYDVTILSLLPKYSLFNRAHKTLSFGSALVCVKSRCYTKESLIHGRVADTRKSR